MYVARPYLRMTDGGGEVSGGKRAAVSSIYKHRPLTGQLTSKAAARNYRQRGERL
jgi:hypothetical protein